MPSQDRGGRKELSDAQAGNRSASVTSFWRDFLDRQLLFFCCFCFYARYPKNQQQRLTKAATWLSRGTANIRVVSIPLQPGSCPTTHHHQLASVCYHDQSHPLSDGFSGFDSPLETEKILPADQPHDFPTPQSGAEAQGHRRRVIRASSPSRGCPRPLWTAYRKKPKKGKLGKRN